MEAALVAIERSPLAVALRTSFFVYPVVNALHILAINAGSHVNPARAGDTVYAWSEILDRAELPGRADIGALRLRLVATRDRPCHDFPYKDEAGRYRPEVLLDLDYWALLPRRAVAA